MGWTNHPYPSAVMGKRSTDLLYPNPEEERRKHKLKRLVQSPNSFFMDVKCPGCFHITPFSAMHRLWSSVAPAPQHCASPPVVGAALLRVVLTERRWMPKYQLCSRSGTLKLC